MSSEPTERGVRSGFGDAGVWRRVGVLLGLSALTLLAGLVYALEPQGPLDLWDRLATLSGLDNYHVNLRLGERWLERSERAARVDADSIAESFRWRATRPLARAAQLASGPAGELAANDRLADAYLALGWRYLEQGRGSILGFGRRIGALQVAEGIAACVIGIAPTRRREEINAFIEELESVLERAPRGRCPR